MLLRFGLVGVLALPMLSLPGAGACMDWQDVPQMELVKGDRPYFMGEDFAVTLRLRNATDSAWRFLKQEKRQLVISEDLEISLASSGGEVIPLHVPHGPMVEPKWTAEDFHEMPPKSEAAITIRASETGLQKNTPGKYRLTVRLRLHGKQNAWLQASGELTIADQKEFTVLKKERVLRPDLRGQENLTWVVRVLKMKLGGKHLIAYEYEWTEVAAFKFIDEVAEDAQFLLGVEDKGGGDYFIHIFYEKGGKVLEHVVDLLGRSQKKS